MPARINSNWRLDSFPTSSGRSSRSSVTIWDVLATESLGRPVTRAERMTLPGASAQQDCSSKERRQLSARGYGYVNLPGPLQPACENRDLNPWDQEGWPSTHAPGRLPFNVFKCTSRRGRKGRIGIRIHRLADSIHRLSHSVRIVTRDVFCHGFRINLTSRLFQSTG